MSIGVLGLYIAYVTPVYLRLRAGDSFKPGPWTLGSKYRWLNPIAVVWVIIASIFFSLPFYARRRCSGTTRSTGTRSTSRRW